MALGYYSFQQQQANLKKLRESRIQENNAYFITDTKDDLENKWQKYLDTKPQILKVILLLCESYQKRKAETGNGGGIDPALLPEIVKRAHKAGLRVAAQIDSAFDYHVALISGVDVMAHLPGYYYGADDTDAEYTLSEADVALTRKRGVVVIPTSNHIQFIDGCGETNGVEAVKSDKNRCIEPDSAEGSRSKNRHWHKITMASTRSRRRFFCRDWESTPILNF